MIVNRSRAPSHQRMIPLRLFINERAFSLSLLTTTRLVPIMRLRSRMRDSARPDLWGAWAGNRPGLPDTHQQMCNCERGTHVSVYVAPKTTQ